MREWWNKIRALRTGRASIDDELADEVRSQVEMETDARIERGMSPEAARAAARRHFGNTTLVTERARDAWVFSAFENLLKDMRYGFRAMHRSPAFSLVLILTFALGVGVNTAIFSVVDAVLLKPLPYPSSERLVMLRERNGKTDFSMTWGNFNYWRQGNHSFEEMAAVQSTSDTVTGHGDAILARGMAVTTPYFRLFAVRPLLGRLLGDQDDPESAPASLVLSHSFWTSRLGGDPHILGVTLMLNGKSYEVVGVAAPQWLPWRADYYLSLDRYLGKPVGRNQHKSTFAVGLLKPGASLAAASADLDAIMRHLAEIDPGPESDHRSFGAFLAEDQVSDIRGTMIVLMAAAALILLIACSNIASLLLARNTARAPELALRKAIGAGQFRLVRQLLAENLAIAAAGGIAGVLFAFLALRLLLGIAPTNIPRLDQATLDPRVLLFAGAITLTAGMLAALAPTLAARRIDLSDALKEGARLAGGGQRGRSFRGALVVAEIAVTFVLAFGSGLLLRSLYAAQTSNPGFDRTRLLSFTLDLPANSYRSPDAISQFYASLSDDLRRIPDTVDVKTVHCPPSAGDCGDWFYSVAGQPGPPRDQVPIALFNSAEPGYFHMMGVPVRQGREFNDTDRTDGPPVAVIDETLARKWWPNESAVGHQIKVGGPYQKGNLLEIVGVAGDIRQSGLDGEPMEEIFQPAAQQSESSRAVMIRTAGDPAKLMPSVRARVSALDRNLPMQRFRTMDDALDAGLARRRFSTLLLALFAGLAMLLAAVGIYGLLNYWVTSREAEIAVRLALGATPSRILRWASSHALRLAAAGVAIGAVGGWFAAALLGDLVFGTPARSPQTMIAAAGAVLAMALAATALPAWRATRVDAARRLHQG